MPTAFASLADVKTFLSITDSNSDPLLTLILNGVNQAIQNYLGRDIFIQSYTEFYDSQGTNELRLRQGPITAVSSVLLDVVGYYGQAPGSFSDPPLIAGIDYAFKPNSSILVRLNGLWPARAVKNLGMLSVTLGDSYGSVQVQYTAGYATIPNDLQIAACIATARIRALRKYGQPVSSESLGNYSYSLAMITKEIAGMADVLTTCSRYRRLYL